MISCIHQVHRDFQSETEWVGIVMGEVGGAINEQKGALTF